MDEGAYEALSRTALLVDLDVFGGTADRRLIVDGLRATTAHIIADSNSLRCAAGQTALVTLYAQLAMTGLQIDLDTPTVALAASQPPLHGADLLSGLLDYTADLLPGGSSRPSAAPDVVFVLGDTPGPAGSVRVSGGPWQAFAGPRSPAVAWRGNIPVGAVAAAAAAAADGVRAAIPNVALRLDRPVPPTRAGFGYRTDRSPSTSLATVSTPRGARRGRPHQQRGDRPRGVVHAAEGAQYLGHDSDHRARPADPHQPQPLRARTQVDAQPPEDGGAGESVHHPSPDRRLRHVLRRRHGGRHVSVGGPRPRRCRPHSLPLDSSEACRLEVGVRRINIPRLRACLRPPTGRSMRALWQAPPGSPASACMTPSAVVYRAVILSSGPRPSSVARSRATVASGRILSIRNATTPSSPSSRARRNGTRDSGWSGVRQVVSGRSTRTAPDSAR